MAEVSVSTEDSPAPAPVPAVRYNFMTLEIDCTGRLLSDEFFHMSCVLGSNKHDVYVMPYRNISYYASMRFQVTTTNHGLYRYLKRRGTGKIIRTKTEMFALQGFLSYLKENSDLPIVLMTYEPYDFAPFILIQALQRYEMMEEFEKYVHGFASSFAFVKKKCKKSVSSMNLRSLAKVLLNKNDVKHQDSLNRAVLLNEIILHLCNGDSTDQAAGILASEMAPYVKPISEVKQSLEVKLTKADRQQSLKPVFAPYLKGPKNRRKILALRKHLIDHDMDYDKLEVMWKEGRDEFKKQMNELLEKMEDKNREDVIAILLLHFDSVDHKSPPKKSAGNAGAAPTDGKGEASRDDSPSAPNDDLQPKTASPEKGEGDSNHGKGVEIAVNGDKTPNENDHTSR